MTSSRKRLNSSTISSSLTSSFSNSIALSSITASAAKIGASERTARAIASLGRESISISLPFDGERDEGVEGVVAQIGDRDLHDLRLELGQHLGDQVVRHRPRRGGALELHQNRGRLRVTDPDRQELVPLGGLQQDDRLLPDHVEAHAVDGHLLHGARPHCTAPSERPNRGWAGTERWAILDSNQGPPPYQSGALTD